MKPRLLVVAGLLLLGCEDRRPLPPVVFEGEHIRYRTFEPEAEVCAGSFFMQDAKAGYLKGVFGTDTVVDFSWVPDDRYFDYCPGPFGCAAGGEAFSQSPVLEHELAHGARAPSYPPFEEGLAVYFGGPGGRDVTPEGTLDALIDPGPDVNGSDYGRLGRFVSYLVAEFGIAEVVALADDAPRGVSAGEFQSAVSRRLGVPLIDLVADFEERYPECRQTSFIDDRPYCDQPPSFTLTGGSEVIDEDPADPIEHYFGLACDDEGTLGARSGKRWRYVTFNVESQALYILTIVPDVSTTGSFVELQQCGTSCFERDFSSALESYDGVPACLGEGTYTMRIALDDGSANGFLFSARATGWC